MGRGAATDTGEVISRTAYAWGGFSSDAHYAIQDALRTDYFGWQEEFTEIWDEDGLETSEVTIGQLVGELDHLIETSPPLKETNLWRGIDDLDQLLALAGADDVVELAGKTITDPGYIATSRKRKVAEFHGHDALIEIEVPAGTRALDLAAHGIHEQEELLFARGSSLRIDSLDKDGGHLKAILVPSSA